MTTSKQLLYTVLHVVLTVTAVPMAPSAIEACDADSQKISLIDRELTEEKLRSSLVQKIKPGGNSLDGLHNTLALHYWNEY